MSKSLSDLHDRLFLLTNPVLDSLKKTNYTLPESTTVSVKSILCTLLDSEAAPDEQKLKHVTLALALLMSSRTSIHESLTWIPERISASAESVLHAISKEFGAVLLNLLPELVPLLKERIKESSIDIDNESDQVTAASARAPVVLAILAAYQFRWFATQVVHPDLGKFCDLVIPCALTALDHWSPEVKAQGMIVFIHLARNVNVVDLSLYEDVILDACCQNIASADEIWHLVVEMSVLLLTSTQRSNCRSSWSERILNEMLSHLERQPRNKDRRVAWLKFIEPLFSALGLVLLAHFSRIFPLFFKWMHVDDDESVSLVLKRLNTVIKLTWIRNSPYVDRLVDELTILYKEAAMRRAREEIRTDILQMLILLQQCKGAQFQAAWNKYKDDPNLCSLVSSVSERIIVPV